jgi:hypothetical protein
MAVIMGLCKLGRQSDSRQEGIWEKRILPLFLSWLVAKIEEVPRMTRVGTSSTPAE